MLNSSGHCNSSTFIEKLQKQFSIVIIIFNFLIIYKEKKKHKQDEAESLSKFLEKFPNKLI